MPPHPKPNKDEECKDEEAACSMQCAPTPQPRKSRINWGGWGFGSRPKQQEPQPSACAPSLKSSSKSLQTSSSSPQTQKANQQPAQQQPQAAPQSPQGARPASQWLAYARTTGRPTVSTGSQTSYSDGVEQSSTAYSDPSQQPKPSPNKPVTGADPNAAQKASTQSAHLHEAHIAQSPPAPSNLKAAPVAKKVEGTAYNGDLLPDLEKRTIIDEETGKAYLSLYESVAAPVPVDAKPKSARKMGKGGKNRYDDFYDKDEQMKRVESKESLDSAPTSEPGIIKDIVARPGESGQVHKVRDWNGEYIALMANYNCATVYKSSPTIAKLASDFQYAATVYAKIIISELCLPHDKKTIPPAALGGIAGGEKYICQGILFKFATDQPLGPDLWMYGGGFPNDELAIKAAGRELSGASWVCGLSGGTIIRTPLMMAIDYKGFRVIAASLLPIGKDTIRYGSHDGGANVHNDDSPIEEAMKQFGHRANLAPHKVGMNKMNLAEIVGPGDIELHLGRDGQVYALDFARLMPPEAPGVDPDEEILDRRAIFYKHLRPELVFANDEPLSSDTFSGWSMHDPYRKEHEERVIKATKKIFEEAIPALAQQLDEFNFNFNEKMIENVRLNEIAHVKGVNVRHLGKARHLVQRKRMKKYIMTYCVARVIKNLLKQKMREKMRALYDVAPSEDPFKEALVEQLNVAYGDGPESDNFWKSTVKTILRHKFTGTLTVKEESRNFDLRASISMKYLLPILLQLQNMELTKSALDDFQKAPEHFIFAPDDVLRIDCTTKKIFLSPLCNAIHKLQQAREIKGNVVSLRILEKGKQWLEGAIANIPNCPIMNLYYGSILGELASRYAVDDSKKADFFFMKSHERFTLSRSIAETSATANEWSVILLLQSEVQRQRGDEEQANQLKERSQEEKKAAQDLWKSWGWSPNEDDGGSNKIWSSNGQNSWGDNDKQDTWTNKSKQSANLAWGDKSQNGDAHQGWGADKPQQWGDQQKAGWGTQQQKQGWNADKPQQWGDQQKAGWAAPSNTAYSDPVVDDGDKKQQGNQKQGWGKQGSWAPEQPSNNNTTAYSEPVLDATEQKSAQDWGKQSQSSGGWQHFNKKQETAAFIPATTAYSEPALEANAKKSPKKQPSVSKASPTTAYSEVTLENHDNNNKKLSSSSKKVAPTSTAYSDTEELIKSPSNGSDKKVVSPSSTAYSDTEELKKSPSNGNDKRVVATPPTTAYSEVSLENGFKKSPDQKKTSSPASTAYSAALPKQ